MSNLEARGRSTEGRVLAALALATVLAACADAPVQVPAPTAPQAAPVPKSGEPGSLAPNPASSLAYCDVATLAAPDRYRIRNVSVKLPRDAFSPNGATVKVGFRVWSPRSPDPEQLAVCTLPNTHAAIAYVKGQLGEFSDPVVLRGQSIGAALAVAAAASPRTLVDGIKVFDGAAGAGGAARMVEPCDPYAIIDPCPPEEEQPVEEGPDPPDPTLDLSLVGDDPASVVAPPVIRCYGRTDYPHRSSTVFGRVNVHGETGCPIPLPISVQVNLAKQKCALWIFCWYSMVASSPPLARVATVARSNASAPCSTGVWRGISYHTISFPPGYYPPSSAGTSHNTNRITYCF